MAIIMINQTRLVLDAASTMKAPRKARLKGLLPLLGDRATSRGFLAFAARGGRTGHDVFGSVHRHPGFLRQGRQVGRGSDGGRRDRHGPLARWRGRVEGHRHRPQRVSRLDGQRRRGDPPVPPPLDTAAAVNGGQLHACLHQRHALRHAHASPVAAYRKTKVSGTDRAWPNCNCTLEHTIFLKLPRKLQQGGKYTLSIAPAVNSDKASQAFTFDIYSSVSEAIHVNLIGYNPDHTAMKSADLYMWLGDGGGRDYSGYVGKKVWLYNVATAPSRRSARWRSGRRAAATSAAGT